MTDSGWDRGLAARVRPYAITGGRTRGHADLPYETIIQTTAEGQHALPRLVMERRRVVELCGHPLSVAEISAHLKLAIGVAMVIVEMENAFLFVTGISDGSCLAVVASATCDVGLVGYEMALLVERVGPVLTPQLRDELRVALPR